MTFRAKALVCAVVVGAIASLSSVFGQPGQQWLHFFVYLVAILLSSGMKVALLKTEGTMTVNFPFILLGILQLSPLQAVALATISVVAQCRIRVTKPFTLIQILFNVANVTTATVLAWHGYEALLRLHIEAAPALAVAATIYFLANTIPVALIIGWESGAPPLSQWRQEFLWYFPFYLVGGMLAAAANFIEIWFGWLTSLLLIPMVYTVYRAYNAQMAIIRDRERHAQETEALHLRTIEGLAMAVEAKDQNTHRHLQRVRVYVSELGKIMGLDESIMKALLTAAYLHDIGKLAIPEHIINKPGKLNREEFEKMKTHTVVGAEILERVRFPYPVVPIVRSHHEAWDGSGYPDGLKGEEIPIGARILTIVDCFDALASDRPYRRALPLEEAMAIVKGNAGIQFDPEIVSLLDEHYPHLEELARREIEDIAPLHTDVSVERGMAPGAGFEPEPAQTSAEPDVQLNNSLEAHETLAAMAKSLQPLVPFDCFAVYLKRGDFVLAQYLDGPCANAFSLRHIPMGEGLSGWVAQSERPIVNGNPTVEPTYLPESALFTANSSALALPMFDENGSVFGVLAVYSRQSAAFTKSDLRMLEAILTRFSHSLQAAWQPRTAEADKSIDLQASLPNRQHLSDRIDGETVTQEVLEGLSQP
jgi:putative nucleotidyltransferase with HDIG domain